MSTNHEAVTVEDITSHKPRDPKSVKINCPNCHEPLARIKEMLYPITTAKDYVCRLSKRKSQLDMKHFESVGEDLNPQIMQFGCNHCKGYFRFTIDWSKVS